MKRNKILEDYAKILSSILKCNSDEILFLTDNQSKSVLIEDIYYYKPDGGTPRNFSILFKKEVISTFKLYEMPHCCAIMISCNVRVEEKFRNKGIGKLLNKFRQDIGRQLGYSLLLCTDIEQNTHQRQLLKTNGWKDIYNVINRRTNNRVFISVINL